MEIVGERLKALRLSQMRIAKTFGAGPSSIYLYESGEAGVPSELLVKSTDYFDVSMDYIFGHTDARHGMYCKAKPKAEQSYPEMNKFIKMCFDPSPPMNARLKETLQQMLNGLLEPFWKIAEIFKTALQKKHLFLLLYRQRDSFQINLYEFFIVHFSGSGGRSKSSIAR